MTIYSVRFNGNDPSRHAAFLQSLRSTGVKPFYTCDLLDPHGARPHGRLSLETFEKSLVRDADVSIRVHPDDGVEVTAAVARTQENPNVVWTARYSIPWSPSLDGRLRDAISDIYQHEFR